ncbi:hypothetical protein BDL97_04G110000 [Sphagnum fallax]|nr:hypothetical protein BDL97_04G110000 [Sphagnum fallax]
MAQQATGPGAGSGAQGNQFGDTTYTKVFVGGLAWETQRDTMRRHFEQFGDILEAVVITDKNTGRSKGYGFVTFRDAEAARRACSDATPIIDGRRANCNLASLGAHRPRPHGQHGPQQGGPGYTGTTSFPQSGASYTHPVQQGGFTYPPYGGYPQYPQDYTGYPQNLFPYGGGGPQYPPQIYGGPGTLGSPVTAGPVYPGFTTQSLQGGPVYPVPQYGVQTPHLVRYSPTGLPQAYVPISTPAPPTGSTPNLSTGVVPGPVSSQQFPVTAVSQQPYISGEGVEEPSG